MNRILVLLKKYKWEHKILCIASKPVRFDDKDYLIAGEKSSVMKKFSTAWPKIFSSQKFGKWASCELLSSFLALFSEFQCEAKSFLVILYQNLPITDLVFCSLYGVTVFAFKIVACPNCYANEFGIPTFSTFFSGLLQSILKINLKNQRPFSTSSQNPTPPPPRFLTPSVD